MIRVSFYTWRHKFPLGETPRELAGEDARATVCAITFGVVYKFYFI
jgi:hypothetical protein